MSMSKKHFNALAQSLRWMRPEPDPEDLTVTSVNFHKFEMWKNCCKAVAGVCMNANYNFDSSRFYTACGMDEPFMPEPANEENPQ